jgi:2,3-bisphosphoglycerate-independent phosphoglycerate mutase
VKTVDQCLGQLIPVIVEQGGAAVITADHGNAEEMYDEAAGQPLSSHTTNPVPFILINTGVKKLRDKGVLADVAPTVLELLEISQPEEMTGRSLIDRD